MSGRIKRWALIVMGVVLVRVAGATVINSESLAQKVAESGTVALAEVTAVEGQAPFNNAHRPVVDLRVVRAWRGAKPGDPLQIKDWSDSPPFAYYADGRAPTPQQIEAARRQWEASPVLPPGKGDRVLLLLGQGEGAPVFGGTPYPDHVVKPDERTLELVSGFLTYGVELTPDEDLRATNGAPIRSSLLIRNLSSTAASFNPGSIRLSLTTPQGATLDRAAPSLPTPVPTVSVPGQGQVLIPIDWRELYPGLFDASGDYWLTIEIPAQGGDRLQRHVIVSEHSVADACGRADQILRVRLKSLGPKDLVIEDPVYLRLRGQALPQTLDRGSDLATAAAGQRWILCAEAGLVTFAGPDTSGFRQQLVDLLANDPPEWWSHAEDADPRFAAPKNQADGPASELHRLDLQRRLQALS